MSEKLETHLKRPEMRFVQLCLQGRFAATAVDDARVLSRQTGFDWRMVRRIGERERLLPLLYNVTKDVEWIPDKLATEFRRSYLEHAMHNAAQLRYLAEVIDLFAEKDLALIVLKGAALAETIYNNIALRPMADVDVLIREDELPEALGVLKDLGYLSIDRDAHPGMTTAYENEILLYRQGKVDAAIELHWSLVDSPHYQQKLRMDWFWHEGVFVQFGYTKTRVFTAEALLLHLCAHLYLHHGGWGLLWLHDIAELLNHTRSTLSWQTICDKGEEFDLVLPLKRVIPLVNERWHLRLKPELLQKLASMEPSERERQVFGWLTARNRPVAQRFLVDLATTATWSGRVGYAWRSLFPTPAYMRQRYDIESGYLLPFYYPYRWFIGLAGLIRR